MNRSRKPRAISGAEEARIQAGIAADPDNTETIGEALSFGCRVNGAVRRGCEHGRRRSEEPS